MWVRGTDTSKSSCSGRKSLKTASGGRELEQQYISVTEDNLVRVSNSAIYESYNLNFSIIKIFIWCVHGAQIS